MAISSICDPDTSDEESNMNKKKDLQEKKKKVQKSTKMIDAKPMRVSIFHKCPCLLLKTTLTGVAL